MLYKHTAKIKNNYCATFARDWKILIVFNKEVVIQRELSDNPEFVTIFEKK